jgi:hypothetical protein
VLASLLKAEALGEIHDAVGYQVSNAPTLVLCVLLNVWQQVCIDLLSWKVLAECDTGVDSLHLD